jgi:hypothetical protein
MRDGSQNRPAKQAITLGEQRGQPCGQLGGWFVPRDLVSAAAGH